MTDLRYHMRKCFPIISIFFVIMFMFALIYGPQLHAGDTMFKDCNVCGHLNYQFSNTCSMCGSTGRFTDVYLKPDCEKRDAKKHKAKEISLTCKAPFKRTKKEMYNQFILPINKVLANIIHYRDYLKDVHKDLEGQPGFKEIYFETLDASFDNLLRAREQLITFHGLAEYRESRKSDELIYKE